MRRALYLAVLFAALACESSPEPAGGNGGSTSTAMGGISSSSGGQTASASGGTAQGGALNGGSSALGGALAAGGSNNNGGSAGNPAGGSPSGSGGASAGATSSGGATSGGGGTAGSGTAGVGGGTAGAGGATAGAGGATAGAGGATQCPAVSAFADWPDKTSPADVGDRLVKNYLARSRGAYHYADACAWYGALKFTKLANDGTQNQKLIKNFDQYLNGANYFPTDGTSVDDRVGGIVPLEIFIQTQDTSKKYSNIGLQPAEAQCKEINANLKSLRYWIDDMFMVTALQVQAYRASKSATYLDCAAKAMVSYLQALQQPNGLFWHTRDSKVHWGRGNGWMAVGSAELLQELPAGTQRDTIMAGYLKMMAALKSVQISQGSGVGLWRQVLDDDTAWFESSGSAMFTYSIATGVKNGWLPAADYASVARNGWLAVVGQLDGSANLQNVCVGTGASPTGASPAEQRAFYLGRAKSTGDLHGQAPVLWSAATLLPNAPCSGR